MKTIIMIACSLVVMSLPLQAKEVHPKKMEKIDRHIVSAGLTEILIEQLASELYIKQLEAAVMSGSAPLSESDLAAMRRAALAVVEKEFLEKQQLSKILYPIYDEHLTLGELNILLQYSETPFASRMQEVMVQVMQKSSEASLTHTQTLTPLLQEHLTASQ
ncbi:DUF2059 domain-containing protein [Aestuariirhabdus sp. Z084]|uniref:DUF2059 domain-containing protein n=1 Tax=Aestuariirhabdus haliotis TaxID=2918751 RepID=UPI00201B3F00|nr:DUF2059 domain-containing protein [Aestuariirhabdus haliotis]MCL6416147.1 DUF2059 domain-containing protein [Aestuariirhabdus haliotis]MCL6420096.1 DUF2059 domain-containing protein [Aestuariirhabdus haliotis]